MYPKPSGGFRRMTRLDPMADLGYRGLVGRTVAPIERALSGAVFNSRSVGVRTSWCSVPWRHAHKRYRAAMREARQDGPEGEAHLDVKDHYGSVKGEALRHCLYSADAPPGAINDLQEALDQLQSIPGMTRGLPVGPEASAPLGTVALLSLDRVLTSSGFEFYRWAGDVVVPMDECEFSRLMDVAAQQLAFGGQQLNMEKCAFVELDDDGFAASLGGGGAMQSDDPLEALRLAASTGNPQGIPYALAGLKRIADDAGVVVLQEHRWVVERFPKQVTAYLKVVCSDWDWVIEQLTCETTESNASAQLHLVRAVGRRALSADTTAALFDHAAGLRRVEFAPVADQYFAVAGQSSEKLGVRRRRALELAEEMSELDAKRALLAAFRGGEADRVGTSGLNHLRRNQPELAMTVEWVRAA